MQRMLQISVIHCCRFPVACSRVSPPSQRRVTDLPITFESMAQVSTPQKRTSRDADLKSDISPYAAKLPKFAGIGGWVDSERAKSDWLQLSKMISQCQQNRSLISILFAKMTEAERRLSSAPTQDQHEIWPILPRNIMAVPEDFVFQFVLSRTDLSVDQLVAVNRRDPKGAHKMMLAMTQLPETLKIQDELLVVAFFRKLLDHCWKLYGERLKQIVASNMLHGDIVYDGQCFTYQRTYNDAGHLEMITHIVSGDAVNIDPTECPVTKAWKVTNMFSDMHAEFQFKGFNGMKLCGFFAKSPPQGPWKYTYYTGAGQKCFKSLVHTVHAEYLEEKAKVSKNEVAPEIQSRLQQEHKSKRDKTIEKAKEAAKVALRKRRELRVGHDIPEST